MKKIVTLLCLTAALAMAASVASAYAARTWRWQCIDTSCVAGKKWSDAFETREEALRVAQIHVQAKNHVITVKQD